jgi:hypothetical protein
MIDLKIKCKSTISVTVVKPFNRVRTYIMKECYIKQIAGSTHDLVSHVRSGLIRVLI